MATPLDRKRDSHETHPAHFHPRPAFAFRKTLKRPPNCRACIDIGRIDIGQFVFPDVAPRSQLSRFFHQRDALWITAF